MFQKDNPEGEKIGRVSALSQGAHRAQLLCFHSAFFTMDRGWDLGFLCRGSLKRIFGCCVRNLCFGRHSRSFWNKILKQKYFFNLSSQ